MSSSLGSLFPGLFSDEEETIASSSRSLVSSSTLDRFFDDEDDVGAGSVRSFRLSLGQSSGAAAVEIADRREEVERGRGKREIVEEEVSLAEDRKKKQELSEAEVRLTDDEEDFVSEDFDSRKVINPIQSLQSSIEKIKVEERKPVAKFAPAFPGRIPRYKYARPQEFSGEAYIRAPEVVKVESKLNMRSQLQKAVWKQVWTRLCQEETVPVFAEVDPVDPRGRMTFKIPHEKKDEDAEDIGLFRIVGVNNLFEAECILLRTLAEQQFEMQDEEPALTKEEISTRIQKFLKPSRNLLHSQGNGFVFLYGSKPCLDVLSKHSRYEYPGCKSVTVKWPRDETPWEEFERKLHSLVEYDPDFTLETDGGRIKRVFACKPLFRNENVGFYCLIEPPQENKDGSTKLGRITIPGGPRWLGESAWEGALRKLKEETGLCLKLRCDTLASYHDTHAVTFFINVDDPTSKEVRLLRHTVSKEGESKPVRQHIDMFYKQNTSISIENLRQDALINLSRSFNSQSSIRPQV